MTITRVGTNEKYASGWESIFGGSKRKSSKGATPVASESKVKTVKKSAKSSGSTKAAPKKVAKKVAAKPTAKKGSKKSR